MQKRNYLREQKASMQQHAGSSAAVRRRSLVEAKQAEERDRGRIETEIGTGIGLDENEHTTRAGQTGKTSPARPS